ncbi:MAG: flagellar filament capping protein FliD [Deltaproteobacteria bacterium]|nr:flagellar filament capping protein FliD [Deltaproteobacteria bacterium]
MGLKSGGIASGIDVEAMVKAVIEVEKAPLNRIKTQESDYQAKISSYGFLKGALTDLSSMAKPLKNPKSFTTYEAVSSSPEILTVTNDITAEPGSYTVNVTRIAKAKQLISDTFESPNEPTGSGILILESESFDDKIEIDISEQNNNNTLQGIVNAINSSAADVTANIVKIDEEQYRLVVKHNQTGIDLEVAFKDDGLKFKMIREATEELGAKASSRGLTVAERNRGVGNGILRINEGPEIKIEVKDDFYAIAKKIDESSATLKSEVTVDSDLADRLLAMETTRDTIDFIGEVQASKAMDKSVHDKGLGFGKIVINGGMSIDIKASDDYTAIAKKINDFDQGIKSWVDKVYDEDEEQDFYYLRIENTDPEYLNGEVRIEFRNNGKILEPVEQGQQLKSAFLTRDNIDNGLGNGVLTLNGKKLNIDADETLYQIIDRMNEADEDIETRLEWDDDDGAYLVLEHQETGPDSKINFDFKGEGLELETIAESGWFEGATVKRRPLTAFEVFRGIGSGSIVLNGQEIDIESSDNYYDIARKIDNADSNITATVEDDGGGAYFLTVKNWKRGYGGRIDFKYETTSLNMKEVQLSTKLATDNLSTEQLEGGIGYGNIYIGVDGEDDDPIKISAGDTYQEIARKINEEGEGWFFDDYGARVEKDRNGNQYLVVQNSSEGDLLPLTFRFDEDPISFSQDRKITDFKGEVLKSKNLTEEELKNGLDAGIISVNGERNIVVNQGESFRDIARKINDSHPDISARIESHPDEEDDDYTAYQLVIENLNSVYNGGKVDFIYRDDKPAEYFLTVENLLTGKEGKLDYTYVAGEEGDGLSVLGITTSQEAETAELSLDGVFVERASNIIDDLIKGVEITLNKADKDQDVTIEVNRTYKDVGEMVTGFVNAYNALVDVFKFLQGYNSQTGKYGVFQSDAVTSKLRESMSRLLGRDVRGVENKVNNISELGAELQSDGKLIFVGEKLNTAMLDFPDEVTKFFSSKGDGVLGIAHELDALVKTYNNRGGIIDNRTKGYERTMKNLSDQADRIEKRAVKKEDMLRKTYENLDKQMAKMKHTQVFLKQQLRALPT